MISSYLWTKISGPASSSIMNSRSAKTLVKTLAAGIYQFELKVVDNKGLSAKDTVRVIVLWDGKLIGTPVTKKVKFLYGEEQEKNY
jgi:hypothetical protein